MPFPQRHTTNQVGQSSTPTQVTFESRSPKGIALAVLILVKR